jgi:SpoVK/Ycf46/Vps4 family AAA+-type ATPase
LVDAHVNRDPSRFRLITHQIAANVAAKSPRGAEQLRKLVEHQQAVALVPLPSANGMLSVPSELASLDDMILTPSVRERLDRIVLEQSRRLDLFGQGLRPARKLLFAGPPGCGKSMAAGAIARAVGLPIFRVELHGVVAQYLGETASKLAKVFEHVRTMPAVYLFDEFDALCSERSSLGGESAGAEMRRVVNSLLQFVEDDRSDSLIVAATNHAQMLDAAIFRRFDEMIAFGSPAKVEVEALVQRSLPAVDAAQLDFSTIYAAVANPKLGHADVCAAVDRVRKDHVLAGAPIDTARIVDALVKRVHVAEVLS